MAINETEELSKFFNPFVSGEEVPHLMRLMQLMGEGRSEEYIASLPEMREFLLLVRSRIESGLFDKWLQKREGEMAYEALEMGRRRAERLLGIQQLEERVAQLRKKNLELDEVEDKVTLAMGKGIEQMRRAKEQLLGTKVGELKQ